MLADHRRQFEAVEVRHADVDQHDRDLVPQQVLQCLAGGVRLDQILAELGEDHLIAHQLRRLVIDQQDVDLVAWLMRTASFNDAATCAVPTAAARC